uniref:Uncharacterized protein n=1 Tax=Plectus sambesii TaxID=2011161 RepID=A0A914WT25_9BILA
MSEDNLYVCCMFSVSCPHRPVKALEDNMGENLVGVEDDFDRLDNWLSSAADPNSMDGDFLASNNN